MVSINFDNHHNAGSLFPTDDGPSSASTLTLAHLSDPHISCMNAITARDLLGKRVFGYLSWKLHRGASHGGSVLSALRADLAKTKPDHITVTGDLTHLSLSAEFKKARQWLQSLGSPSQVTVIPGNHDTYVHTDWHKTMAYWTEYMLSDTPRDDSHNGENMARIFPCLRIRRPCGHNWRMHSPAQCAASGCGQHRRLTIAATGENAVSNRPAKVFQSLADSPSACLRRGQLAQTPNRCARSAVASRPLWGGADLARSCASRAPKLSEDSVRQRPGYGRPIDHGPGPRAGASRQLLHLPYIARRRQLECQASGAHLFAW